LLDSVAAAAAADSDDEEEQEDEEDSVTGSNPFPADECKMRFVMQD